MNHLFTFKVVLIWLVMPLSLFAQQTETGNWLMYFGMNKINDEFSIHSEIQYRNYTIAPVNIEQLLLRTGFNYHFSEKAFLSAGYAYVAGHEFDSEQAYPESEEHRIWQQFIMNDKIGRVKFEHRYRVEQRWLDKDYKNRFRYRLMMFIPLNKPQMEANTFFLSAYNEIFINGEASFFDRNRLYGALGYQFNKSTNLQIGLLHQQDIDFGKIYIQVALILNLDFRNIID